MKQKRKSRREKLYQAMYLTLKLAKLARQAYEIAAHERRQNNRGVARKWHRRFLRYKRWAIKMRKRVFRLNNNMRYYRL